MRRLSFLCLVTAALAGRAAAPLVAQESDRDPAVWQLEGLRSAFCVQLLLDPASTLLGDIPKGFRPLPASEVTDLHVSLKSVVEGQPEFASWSPSRLCFHAMDTVRTSEFIVADGSGRRPQLFGTWTVTAADPGGTPREVTLELFSNNGRLIRSARLAGHSVREARLTVGKVPAEDENGIPSTDDRFQVRIGKMTVTWDGRLAGDSTAVSAPVETTWTGEATRGGVTTGRLTLRPAYSRAMVGSLKVDGKDDFAKALKGSPTRFAGPAYRGGGGVVALAR
jgi:hypothetical protein